ncbi:energy transducer TonB [Sphingomonas sp. A2-49]|uniref:energy transducer TonB n=1 Tax=Sphingomonas sp. A2-49 TaxID=1391375 RepID=UPI0021CEE320|nr:energy transducer TonB [Sphingomonas sp. A2-49]MCU6454824.1 energy transducer TonB [Sphingomonas sp. A2-49]
MPMMLAFIMMQMVAPAVSEVPGAVPPRLLNPDKILDYNDYPVESLRREEYGIASIRLRVAADGAITGCDVTETSGHPLLDARSCTLYRTRARVAPARDAAGAAIAGELRAVVSWGVSEHQPRSTIDLPMRVSRMPPDYRTPVRARLVSDAAGRIVACDILESSGSGAGDRAACAYVRQALVLPAPKTRSADVPPAAVRYLTATLVTTLPSSSARR